MRNEQALQILNGDFSGIDIPEGKTHSDLYAEAFEMAKEALKGEKSHVDRITVWHAEKISEYCRSGTRNCDMCTFRVRDMCGITGVPAGWVLPERSAGYVD